LPQQKGGGMKNKLLTGFFTGLFIIYTVGMASADEILNCDFEFGIP